MLNRLRTLPAGLKLFFSLPGGKTMLLFSFEGLLFQFAISMRFFANNLYATNLGASDTQIGLIQTIGCAVTIALVLPAGILSDRMKSSKTMPIIVLFLGGLMYIMHAFVPQMGSARLMMFFVFMGLATGMFGTYSAQWQSMFGDLVDIRARNRVYALRVRVMAALGIVVPMACGTLMTSAGGTEAKLGVLSVFYCIAGVMMLIQAFVVMRIPGGKRSEEQLSAIARFSISEIGHTISAAAKNKRFMSFVGASLLVYTCWQFDWSMWYIGQVDYMLLTEAQMSYFNAVCSVLQIFAFGVFAWLNQKKSVHFTICLNVLALVLYPIYILLLLLVPPGIRQWAFIPLCATANMLECGTMMCLIQMMLEVVPERHRSLTISLYTVLTTLSNCVMPLLGVQVYTALGGNLAAFRMFQMIDCGWRAGVLTFFIIRYLRMKRTGTLVNPLAG